MLLRSIPILMFRTILETKYISVDATWAIAVGALAIAISLIFGSKKSHYIVIPRGPFRNLSDRLWYSLAVSGTILTLIGSVMLGFKYYSQSAILIPMVVIMYLIFHVTASFKLRQLYKNMASTNNSTGKHQTLMWCLLNPYKKLDEVERIIESFQ